MYHYVTDRTFLGAMRALCADTINRLVNPYQREMTLEDTNIVLADGYMEG